MHAPAHTCTHLKNNTHRRSLDTESECSPAPLGPPCSVSSLLLSFFMRPICGQQAHIHVCDQTYLTTICSSRDIYICLWFIGTHLKATVNPKTVIHCEDLIWGEGKSLLMLVICTVCVVRFDSFFFWLSILITYLIKSDGMRALKKWCSNMSALSCGRLLCRN